jgi:hypothetical protein
MPHPGEVFYLPPETREGEHKGDRPHVLMSLCPPGSEVVTFAYGSTKNTDTWYGAEHVLVDPRSTWYGGTGLSEPTFVYPSRLVSYPAVALPEAAGRIVDELPVLRASLRRALGFGAGVTSERNVPGSSRRGRVVALKDDLAEEWGARCALIVTEPAYSRTGFQQTVVPILEDDCEPAELDVIVPSGSNVTRLGTSYAQAMLAVTMVATLYQPDHIARYLGLVIEPWIMRQVEVALSLHFGL